MKSGLRIAKLLVVGMGVSSVLGCGGDSVKTVDVSGIVTLDDKPMPNIRVNFVSDAEVDGKKHVAVATTDSAGKFTLKAAPGMNTVTFAAGAEGFAGDAESGMDPGQAEAAMTSGSVRPSVVIPDKYTKDGEKFEVPEGGSSDANFKLSSSG